MFGGVNGPAVSKLGPQDGKCPFGFSFKPTKKGVPSVEEICWCRIGCVDKFEFRIGRFENGVLQHQRQS